MGPFLPRSLNRGLIEATVRSPMVTTLWPLPRSLNRGLIEASIELAEGIDRDDLPRSLNRGLIEAEAANSRKCDCPPPSTVSEPWPH